MIVHIVCFTIKSTEKASKKENVSNMISLLRKLPSKLSEIVDFEVGENFNESDAAYDVSLYSTFKNRADLEAYAIHPEHLKVIEFVKTIATNRVVVDYEK